MELPNTLVKRATNAELVAATYNNQQSVRLKATCPEEILQGVPGSKATDWTYIRPEPVFKYKVPPFYKPAHSKVLHTAIHLFLRQTWPRYKRVDDYLKDIFFFEDNRPKVKPKVQPVQPVYAKHKTNDTKTSKSRQHK